MPTSDLIEKFTPRYKQQDENKNNKEKKLRFAG
jgi:hypothetical protein